MTQIDKNQSQRKYYAWGGSSVLCEYTEALNGTGFTFSKSYIYAGSRLLSTQIWNGSTETTEFHHPDRLGTKLVTNNAANTFYEQSTLPFGTSLDAEFIGQPTTNQRFTSYDRSTTAQLDYAVNRSYSSGQGRFTSVDPIGLGASSLAIPQSLNLYAYTQNNPIDFIDPLGLNLEAPKDGEACQITPGAIDQNTGLPLYDGTWRGGSCKSHAGSPVVIYTVFQVLIIRTNLYDIVTSGNENIVTNIFGSSGAGATLSGGTKNHIDRLDPVVTPSKQLRNSLIQASNNQSKRDKFIQECMKTELDKQIQDAEKDVQNDFVTDLNYNIGIGAGVGALFGGVAGNLIADDPGSLVGGSAGAIIGAVGGAQNAVVKTAVDRLLLEGYKLRKKIEEIKSSHPTPLVRDACRQRATDAGL